MSMSIFVRPDGTIERIASDSVDLSRAGKRTIARASHVEPTGPADRPWEADLSPVGGPKLGPFAKRGEALKAEVEWLENRMTQGALEVA